MDLSELEQLLKMRGGFEAVNQVTGDNQIRMLGRVPNEMMKAWLVVIHQLLTLSNKSAWSADISKQYFLRGDRVLFAWRVIFQGEKIQEHLPAIAEVVTNSPRPRNTVEEQPLVGVSANRNSPKSGKGAQGVLNAVVGPMAVRQMGGG